MVALQAADLVYEGFDSVPTIDGAPIRKECLASKIKQSEATIEKISSELKEKLDGVYKLDDPFATRLIVEKEQIMHQLNQFSHEAFGGVEDASTRKALEEKFTAYIEAVTARNDLILQYNIKVNMVISKKQEKEAYKAKQTELADRKVDKSDPDLASITAYVGAIYQASRSRMFKLLDLLLRSLNFRMLIHSDIYSYAFPGTDPKQASSLDNIPLSLTSTVLNNVRQNVQDRFSKMVEHWGSEPAKFPEHFDTDVGKRYYLSSGQLKTLLKKDRPTVRVSQNNPVLLSFI